MRVIDKPGASVYARAIEENVSLPRFFLKLNDREGTFVLQGSEHIENGKIKATWFVVPETGTDSLSGLRGTGGFEGDFEKGSQGSLDYWFE